MPSKIGQSASTPDYAGHRARLRDKLLNGPDAALADYELLELLLMISIPRRDVKPLAKALLREFDTFAAVINAKPDALAKISGVGETTIAALKAVQAATVRATQIAAKSQPILSGWTALIDYLTASMAHDNVEQFRVLFLNSKNMLLKDEVVGHGTVNRAPAYPREIMGTAINLGATAIILCHNHPSGDPTPSHQDIALTREIIEVGKKLSVSVHDHVIIGKYGHQSLRNMGLID